MSNIIAQWPTEDAPLGQPGAVLLLEGGVGDLGAGSGAPGFTPRTGAQVYSNALQIVSLATNSGFTNIFIATVCPSSSIASLSQRQERTNYNNLLHNGTNNGYRVLETDAWIAQSTNDTRYYQFDGIHWTDEYEAWLGLYAIPDAIGYTEAAPVLHAELTGAFINVSWNLRANATNTLQEAVDVAGPWTNVFTTFSTNTDAVSVERPDTADRLFYRLFTSHVDFPTFFNLVNGP